MKYLITGAQFNNKGAQSLLFTAISEIKKRDIEADFYYLPIDDPFKYDAKLYNFKIVFDDMAIDDCNFDFRRNLRNRYYCFKDFFKFLFSKSKLYKLSYVLNEIDYLVDVSGYALTSKFDLSGAYRYCRLINSAKSRGKKVVLMPQSFGPFNYENDLKKLIVESLNKVDLICCRESEGVHMLKEIGVTNQVLLRCDIVLSSDETQSSNIYVNKTEPCLLEILTKNNVGIVPNKQLLKHGNVDNVMGVYKLIIEELISKNKNIYIFKHSNDMEMCRMIYSLFEVNELVHLIEEDIDCLAFGEFLKRFDFIIGARYHSIVHAYKVGVPCLILGWAIKYVELAKLFGQERFVFDITEANSQNILKITDGLNYLCDSSRIETERISNCLMSIKANNCFDLFLSK